MERTCGRWKEGLDYPRPLRWPGFRPPASHRTARQRPAPAQPPRRYHAGTRPGATHAEQDLHQRPHPPRRLRREHPAARPVLGRQNRARLQARAAGSVSPAVQFTESHDLLGRPYCGGVPEGGADGQGRGGRRLRPTDFGFCLVVTKVCR